jgi:c-di-GMP-binding flagellar brake protein YcgR
MVKEKDTFVERRRYVRLSTPISITFASTTSNNIWRTVTKNISADGIRFETMDPGLKESSVIEIKLDIPSAPNPVHAKGTIIWRNRVSLEDGSPFDCGVEFTEIEEDNKNTFLKFLCDLIYGIKKEPGNGR